MKKICASVLSAKGMEKSKARRKSTAVGPTSGARRWSGRPQWISGRAFDFSIPFADNTDAQIFFIARLPRTLAGAGVGALFAAAGVVFQGLLRNPLATPFTLGVSTGAALGAILAITFNWSIGVTAFRPCRSRLSRDR